MRVCAPFTRGLEVRGPCKEIAALREDVVDHADGLEGSETLVVDPPARGKSTREESVSTRRTRTP
jgi:hypothetical protein